MEEHGGEVVQREMGVVSRSGSPLALGLAQGLEVLLKVPNCPGRAEQLRAGAEAEAGRGAPKHLLIPIEHRARLQSITRQVFHRDLRRGGPGAPRRLQPRQSWQHLGVPQQGALQEMVFLARPCCTPRLAGCLPFLLVSGIRYPAGQELPLCAQCCAQACWN